MSKIMLLIPGFYYGGAEKMFYELATRLDKNRCQLVICGLKGWGPWADALEKKGFKVITLNMHENYYLTTPFNIVYILYKLIKLIKKEKIKIMHSFLFRANILGRIAGKMAGVRKIICSFRGIAFDNKYHLWLESATQRMVDIFTANSNGLKKCLIEKTDIPLKKIKVIYNGIDLQEIDYRRIDIKEKRAEFGLSMDDYLIGTVSRLHPEKGVEYLIKGILPVIRNNSLIKFMYVGEGELEFKIKEMVDSEKIGRHIILTGFRKDVIDLLKIFDLFVFTSLGEGMPNALLEAMACRLPIVATKVRGVEDLIEHNRTGILVSSDNYKELTQSVIWMFEHKQQARMMGEQARNEIEKNYTMEKMVTKTELLYFNE